jgi:hypothetical protein
MLERGKHWLMRDEACFHVIATLAQVDLQTERKSLWLILETEEWQHVCQEERWLKHHLVTYRISLMPTCKSTNLE